MKDTKLITDEYENISQKLEYAKDRLDQMISEGYGDASISVMREQIKKFATQVDMLNWVLN